MSESNEPAESVEASESSEVLEPAEARESTELRDLLTAVAEGRMAPEEAARHLPAPPPVASGDRSAEPPDAGSHSSVRVVPAPPATAASPAAARVVVRATAHPVRLIADPAVTTVDVSGPHRVVRDGDTVRVDADLAPVEAGGYRQERPTGFWKMLGGSGGFGERLTVRVNPDLPVEVEITAGALEAVNLSAPLRFRVTAGSVRATECTGALDGVVQAGSARLDVRVTEDSRLRCESGSLDLRLLPGSDVRIRSEVDLGELKLRTEDGSTSKLASGGRHELVAGAGTAVLDLSVVMGSAKVRLP